MKTSKVLRKLIQSRGINPNQYRKVRILNQRLMCTVILLTLCFMNCQMSDAYDMGIREPIEPVSSHTKPWVDPAPTPTDPTDPRDPRPPSPVPYPDPRPPSPIPVTPDVRELIDIIKSLRSEIQFLRMKILDLETKLEAKTQIKENHRHECTEYSQQLRKAIIKLIKIDKDPELSSRNVDRLLLSRLFRAGLIEYIPPYHGVITGNLETEIYCPK